MFSLVFGGPATERQNNQSYLSKSWAKYSLAQVMRLSEGRTRYLFRNMRLVHGPRELYVYSGFSPRAVGGEKGSCCDYLVACALHQGIPFDDQSDMLGMRFTSTSKQLGARRN